ncbi:MAG: hypothetical protein H7222_05590 [Methylotenera sp.]|nr:hypothetical protein [Oligoflexia bacterium]
MPFSTPENEKSTEMILPIAHSVVASGTGQTQDTSRRHALLFQVGSISSSMTGNYSDYITVTATSNE